MPKLSTMEAVRANVLHVIYVLDTSGSMRGLPIQRLNRAMEETVLALRQVAARDGKVQLKISVLTFGTGCRWLQSQGPEDVDDFLWNDLSASGLSNTGAALRELGRQILPGGVIGRAMGNLPPLIIFMMDGFSTDDFVPELVRLQQNPRFSQATRIGFAVGKAPDVEEIVQLVGDRQAVIRTENLNEFARLLRTVSVAASSMVSVSANSGMQVDGASAVRDALGGEAMQLTASQVVWNLD